jgi:hypothetical protein
VSSLLIVVIAVLVVLALVAIVGAAGISRRNRAGAAGFTASLDSVDRQLARAVAEDRGWERSTLEAIARSEFTARRRDAEISALELVQLVDEPGTDQDMAVFRVALPSGAARITLARREGEWYAASVEDE